jgi:hypothetical protein
VLSIIFLTLLGHEVKIVAKKQLELWGIGYFDLFLVQYSMALEYVDPARPEWFGDDRKIHLCECRLDMLKTTDRWRSREYAVV